MGEGSGAAEVVSLTHSNIELSQCVKFEGSFDAFGYNSGADVVGEPNERAGQCSSRWVGVDAAGEVDVEFDDVGAEPKDVTQAGVPGSGVIDRDACTETA